jgi:photosystem II stability/assembly factor-like uncharacterized protein
MRNNFSLKLALTMMLMILIVLVTFRAEGQTWKQVWPKPGVSVFNDIHISASGKGVIISADNVGMITSNAGQNWIKLNLGDHETPSSFHFVNDSLGYMAVKNGFVRRTTDGGYTWTSTGAGQNFDYIRFASQSIGFASVNGQIFRTTNGGTSWQARSQTNSNTPSNFTVINQNSLYATWSNLKLLMRSTDGGSSWTQQDVGSLVNIQHVKFLNPNFGILVGNSGLIGKTTDGGQNWQLQYYTNQFGISPYFYRVDFLDENSFVVSSNTFSIKTNNGGASFSPVSNEYGENVPAQTVIGGFHLLNDSIFYVCGGRSLIAKSTNGGTSWTVLTKGNLNDITGGCFQNQNRVWLAAGNSISYSDDKGLTWMSAQVPENEMYYDVKFPTPAVGYICGRNIVLKTTTGGATWSRLTSIPNLANQQISNVFTHIRCVSADTLFVSGWGGILRSYDGGNSWSIVSSNWFSSNVNRTLCWFTDGRNGIKINGLISGEGYICRTTNGGNTWMYIDMGQHIPYPYSVHFVDKLHGWYAGHSYIVRTTDGGQTWTRHDLAFQTIGYGIYFSTPMIGYVSSISLDPMFTTDGGVSWTPGTNYETNYNNHAFLGYNGVPALIGGEGGTIIRNEDWQTNFVSVAKGTIRETTLSNCSNDTSTGRPIANAIITSNPSGYFTSTNESGDYYLWLDSGAHQLSQIIYSPINIPLMRQICPQNNGSRLVEVLGDSDTLSSFDFENQTRECPIIQVSQVHGLLRPCMSSRGWITVSNVGNQQSLPTYVFLKFPNHLHFVSSTLFADFNAIDSTYRFSIPALAAGQKFTFMINDSVSCLPNVITGLNLCIEATIRNSPACLWQSPNWDGVNLEVASRCVNGSPRFTIRNSGASMSSTREYRIFINNDLAYQANFQLAANSQMSVSLPSNAPQGHVRLEVPQSEYHPLSTFAAADANCQTGSSTNGNFPPATESPLVDIVCVTVTNAYDPNDKLVWPKGVGSAGNIEPRTPLRYTLRFQNTGTDTAFNVVVRDTLSQHLDIESFQLGASSHPCRLVVSGQGRPVLNFHFDNILLPDSNANEPMSHGQVTFTIRPKRNLPPGTRIENFADIYFDFNDPIRTNTTVNTLYLPTITPGILDTVIVTTGTASTSEIITKRNIQLKPNPASGHVDVVLPNHQVVSIVNAQGKVVLLSEVRAKQHRIDISSLKPGIYIVTAEGVRPERLVVKP